MKKTLTANVSGTVFHIEEDAYDRLQQYLNGIRAQFEGTDGREEIMADIEARIAELFNERLDGKRQVVAMGDVEHVIGVMGQPEDYADGEGRAEAESTVPPSSGKSNDKGYKRLFRDPDDKWVGGVCAGLAAYIGMDPIWLRIILIVLFFLGTGVPFLLYLILWILVPKAESAADRLRMEGEPVTVDNLKRAFEEGGKRVANEAKDLGRNWSREARTRSGSAAGIIGKLLGAGIILIAFSLLLSLITAAVGGAFGLWHATWSTDDLGVLDIGALIFETREQALWLGIGALTLCLIPIVAIMLAGFRLLLDTRTPGWFGWTLALLWIAALVPTIWGGLQLGRDFHRRNSTRTEVTLASPSGDVLYLDAMTPSDTTGWSMHFDEDEIDIDLEGLHIENGRISGGWARLDVEQSPDSLYHLVTVRSAQGRSAKDALARANNISTEFRQEGDVLFVSPVLRFSAEDKIRIQDARFTLLVPVGKSVFFRPGSRDVIHDVDNVTNTRDHKMLGKAWRMTDRGLEEARPGETLPDSDTDTKKDSIVRKEQHQHPADRKVAINEVRLPSVLHLLRLSI